MRLLPAISLLCASCVSVVRAGKPIMPGDFVVPENELCLGWAVPEWGEIDLWMDGGEVRLIWGPPIERFIRRPLPSSSSTRTAIEFTQARIGPVKYVGAWLLSLKTPSPLAGGGKGFETPLWRELAASRLTVVEGHKQEPCLVLSRKLWRNSGLSCEADLLAYRDRTAVIYAHELILSPAAAATAERSLLILALRIGCGI